MSVEIVGAPLLPLPNEKPEERFCVAGPYIAIPGAQALKTSGRSSSTIAFPDLVARLETGVGQASLLLSDRLHTLRERCGGMLLPNSQTAELCEIADGINAASYHVQKWAHFLAASEHMKRPIKPTPCENGAEAFAAMHFAVPRLVVAATEAHRGLSARLKACSEKAEEQVRALGIPLEDLQALAPHLEIFVARVARLSSIARPRRPSECETEPPSEPPSDVGVAEGSTLEFQSSPGV